MPVGKGRAERIEKAAEDALLVIPDIFLPQVSDEVSQFKYDKLIEALNSVVTAAPSRDEQLIRMAGVNAFYRYVLFQGRVIKGENSTLEVVDAFEEVFDLMSLIVAL